MEEELDLSSAKLIQTQHHSFGGPDGVLVSFEVKYYELPDGTIALVTKPEHKKYLDQILAMRKG